ncbi:hypothetical protein GOQ29_08680 [Clostridium sp. D2Q-14]|uniref:hypothetical protein n=1 Tax=Anaeromonas gelatinilytica TaxID=2683194 RepID=UPI00193B7291|nr:hypothetical protein [Anaeromonas gelatinilytica]MBS4535690.1 hypothetical protein [Anaeromonas gelatinilytica]
MNEMFTMTVMELSRAIRDKRIGVKELTRAYIERIKKFEGLDGLNTVSELNYNAIVQAKKWIP